MRYLSIDMIEPGQILGRSIFSSNGAVLLSEKVELTVYMINTLKRIGVTMLYIKDEHYEDVEISDPISQETKSMILSRMNETFDSLKSGKDFHTKAISQSADQLIDEILQNKEVLIQLSDIRTKDNAHYFHGLNVCMMSTLMGINLGLSMIQLKDLAIGALLHDLGKINQTEEDESDPKTHHTWKGFQIIKQKQEFNLLIAHVALQHHELPDGSGLPRGLESDNIHLYAKIVAVANHYDNQLHDLSQGKRVLPHEACEEMMALTGKQLDHHVVVQFLKTISIYPNGYSVRLSTRETGVVVGQHRGLPARPIVRVITPSDNGEMDVKEIDLAKHTTVFIDTVLST